MAFTAANLTDQLTCEKILENDDISLLGYYLWLDKLTRRSGTILDKSHQDIKGRKLRKLGKSQERDESVLHLAHAQPNFYLFSLLNYNMLYYEASENKGIPN